jgi:hypothetical protein
MDRQPVIHDWYCRMMLGQALTDVWLARDDLMQAGLEAERFLALTLATAERTWQALAWEASARVTMAGGDHHRACTCIEKAPSAMEGFEVPLAAWRVHRSAADLGGASV